MIKTATKRAFGARLRKLRNDSGLTLKELGRRLGVKLGQVSKVEAGWHVPPLETLLVLARELGCSLDYLLGGDEKYAAPPKSARLARRLRELEQLEAKDVEAVILLIDALLDARRSAPLPTARCPVARATRALPERTGQRKPAPDSRRRGHARGRPQRT